MKKVISSLFLLSIFFVFSSQVLAYSPTGSVCSYGDASTEASVCQNNGNGAISGSDGTLNKVINILSIIVGIVAIFMIVVGGLLYVLSSGESQRVNTAKNTILFAVVGIVIVAIAQIILAFFVRSVTKK